MVGVAAHERVHRPHPAPVSTAQASAEPVEPIADDLPDIVDIVMKMGRHEDPSEEQAPSPSLPVARRSGQRPAGHLDALADRARGDLSEGERKRSFARHSLRAGHASAEMTRK